MVSEDRKSTPKPMRPPLADVLGWHVAWSLGLMIGGALVALSGLTSAAIGALVVALLPPVLAQILLKFDSKRSRTGLLGLWAVCVAAACALAGGVSGPLSPWLFMPIGIAGVLGRAKMLAKGAAFSVAAAFTVLLLQTAGLVGPQITGLTDLLLFALAALTTAIGLGSGLIIAAKAEDAGDPALLQSLLDGQPHLLVLAGADGRVLKSYGPALKGVVRSKLATGLDQAARPEDKAKVLEAMSDARRDGRASVAFVGASGDNQHIALDLRHLGDGRLIGTLRDATAEHERLEAIETARSDAESMASGKSRFLASMSHELRTPLNAILGFSDVMRQKMFGALPGKYVEYAQLIHESGEHLLDLISDVLDMSKIEANKYELAVEPMDAREPVQAALRIVRVQADEAGVRLSAALPPNPIDVDADRRALKQIVLNLVSNAIKFTPRGGSVTVGLIGRGKDLELVVADTGVGIAEEDLKKVGRPYEQVGDAERKVKGTGLGLSLVRAFAELHGGQMNIESRLGAGTAVTVRMPVVHESAKPAPPSGENVVAFPPR